MADAMIRCPNTSEPVPTGIGIPFDALKHSRLRDNIFRCSACGEDHVWNTEDAFPDS